MTVQKHGHQAGYMVKLEEGVTFDNECVTLWKIANSSVPTKQRIENTY